MTLAPRGKVNLSVEWLPDKSDAGWWTTTHGGSGAAQSTALKGADQFRSSFFRTTFAVPIRLIIPTHQIDKLTPIFTTHS